jgi:hypothetical protein
LVQSSTNLLDKYVLKKKTITYVKDEKHANLNVMTNALKLVVSCESFGLEEIFKELFWPCFFQGISIWHNK